MKYSELANAHCENRKGQDGLTIDEIKSQLAEFPDWELGNDDKSISKDFSFKDFRHTLGFINAVGFMANSEDHHPDLEAGYGHCRILWSTHDVGGLSMNDFICAARVEALLR